MIVPRITTTPVQTKSVCFSRYETHRRMACALVILIFVIVVAAWRLPFLSNVLVGEEGTHAYLVLGPHPVIVDDNDGFIARVDGKDILESLQRSVLLYQFLDIVARQFGLLLPPCRDDSIACISLHGRAPFLAVFLAGLLAALFAVRRYLAFDRPWTLAVQLLIFFYILCAPLVVGGSIQPQIDGALGVLIVTSSAALLLSSKEHPVPYCYLAAFAGGLVGALGKNEWAIALAGSAVALALLSAGLTLASAPNQRDWKAVRQGRALCIAILTGIIICQWLLYLHSPSAFIAGLDVMLRINAMRLSIIELVRDSWNLLYPVFLACGMMLVLIAIRLKQYCLKQPSVVIVAGWAAIIVVGYVYSGWTGDGFERYYCPPALLAAIALIYLVGDLHYSRGILCAASAALVLGIGANGMSLLRSYSHGLTITSLPGSSLAAIESRYTKLASRYTGVPIFESSAIGIYYKNIDFVARDVGVEGAKSMLQRLRPERPPELMVPSQ